MYRPCIFAKRKRSRTLNHDMFDLIKILISYLTGNPEKEIARFFNDNHLKLAVGESCTGGLVSSLLTDIPGSSGFIRENFVTYSNEAKQKYLNVSSETLEKFGAVSEQTAKEAAEGLLKATNADFSLMTTGIAGPAGGTAGKPVGLVYIGVASKSGTKVLKFIVPKIIFERKMRKAVFAKKALLFLNDFLPKT